MRILFYARDPGAANVVIPVINRFDEEKNHCLLIFAKDYAVSRFDSSGLECSDLIIESFEEAISFLQKVIPDVIITGSSLDDFTERYLWRASEELRIPSYAIMDQWILLGIRFSRYNYSGIEEYRQTLTHEYYPRRILVMDDVAANRLIEDGVPSNKIAITGQPHFDDIRKKFELAQLRDVTTDIKTIIFASEPKIDDGEVSHLGYSERSIFDIILETVQEISKKYRFGFCLIIRPHPREKADNWSDVLNNCDAVSMDRETDSFTLMKNADLVCGMSSMFLVEAAICKVPIVSCLIGLKSESPFIFDQIGVYNSCRNREELYDQLKRVLVDGASTDIKMDFIVDATDKTVNYIMEDVKNARIGN